MRRFLHVVIIYNVNNEHIFYVSFATKIHLTVGLLS